MISGAAEAFLEVGTGGADLGLFGFEEGYMPQINWHLGELLGETV